VLHFVVGFGGLLDELVQGEICSLKANLRLHLKPKLWKAVHRTSCLQSSAAFVGEVARSDGSEI